MILLENDVLRVTIAKKGAEIQSIVDKRSNGDLLWNGDPAFWGKHSPVLFPIVGALKGDRYFYEGQKFELSRHGFARDFDFEIVTANAQHAEFLLRESEETLKKFPFRFNFYISYRLDGHKLTVHYRIENPADSNLLFSVGGHPAFAVKTDANISYEDYFLHFNNDTHLTVHKIIDNLISEETYVVPLPNGKLALNHALFYEDALVMKDVASDCISLCNTQNADKIDFRFSNFPYFGIWAAKDANFVCLEPWCGIADSEAHSQQLIDKEGIITLQGGATWSRHWSVDSSIQ